MHFHYLSRPTARDVVTPRAELEVNLSQLEKKSSALVQVFGCIIAPSSELSYLRESDEREPAKPNSIHFTQKRKKKIEKSFDGNQKQFFFTSWYE